MKKKIRGGSFSFLKKKEKENDTATLERAKEYVFPKKHINELISRVKGIGEIDIYDGEKILNTKKKYTSYLKVCYTLKGEKFGVYKRYTDFVDLQNIIKRDKLYLESLTEINLSGRIAKSFGNRNGKLEKYMNTIKDLLKEDESTDGSKEDESTGDGSMEESKEDEKTMGVGSTDDEESMEESKEDETTEESKEDEKTTGDGSRYDDRTKLGVLFANFLVSSTIYDSDIEKSEELKDKLKKEKEEKEKLKKEKKTEGEQKDGEIDDSRDD